MKNLFLTFAFLLFTINCGSHQSEISKQEINFPPVENQTTQETVSANSKVSPDLKNTEPRPPYPGISIEGEFPIIADHDFQEKALINNAYTVKTDEFQIGFKNFTPTIIQDKNGKTLFKFKTLQKDHYSSDLVGISYLLGEKSKEIYVVSQTGGICCTNYWINDVSSGIPRNIFRSEDFGYFRDSMEIFDADDDGLYELMQWDSAFRYFLDDCGACSPEPRAIFKYDKKSGTYLAAKNIQQDFVKKVFLETEKWITESFEKLEKFERTNKTENQEYLSLRLDYNRRFLDYVVDIFYLGDEKKAWKNFNKYYNGYNEKEKVSAEIKNRLRESKFYQALKKSS